MRYEKKIIIKTRVCDRCGEEFEYQADNALEERDWTEAFPDISVHSVRCPYCNYRNILKSVKTSLLSADRS